MRELGKQCKAGRWRKEGKPDSREESEHRELRGCTEEKREQVEGEGGYLKGLFVRRKMVRLSEGQEFTKVWNVGM